MKGMVVERPWYVIQTRSRFEKKCTELLLKKSISVYLPLQKKMKVWSDRMKEIQEPLFSGYLFVQFSENERYSILNTPGVVRFISFGSKYATVNTQQIESIKKAITANITLDVIDVAIEPGQEVLITSGPFKDNYAQLVRYNGKGKLLLSLDSIGKAILLEIGRTQVEALTNSSRLKASA
jgi:transcription antitermination factor NusG